MPGALAGARGKLSRFLNADLHSCSGLTPSATSEQGRPIQRSPFSMLADGDRMPRVQVGQLALCEG
jgi:hypothetical protein